MRDDDEIWFDSLAGRPGNAPRGEAPGAEAPGAEAPGDAHGTRLRAALRAQNASQRTDVAEVDLQREAALIARARATGLLTPAAAPAPRARSRWPVWLAAATLASIVVGVTLQQGNRTSSPVLRGGELRVVRIRAPDPARLKQELIRELSQAGVHATGYVSFGREGLDADLPRPLTDEVRKVLARHGIEPPADAALQVEIEPAGPQ